MKILRFPGSLLLLLAVVFVVSCDTIPTRPATDTGARFHDSGSVNVAFQFSRWDTIYMLRPDTRENGFFPVYGRDDLAPEIERRSRARDLAVVVLGYIFSPDLENAYMRDWETLLGERGFRRVVFLRAGEHADIDGLLIVRDSAIAVANDEKDNRALRLAAVPSAP